MEFAKKNKIVVTLICLLVISGVAFFISFGSNYRDAISTDKTTKDSSQEIEYETLQAKAANQTVELYIADTAYKRQIGLSGRENLDDGTGMLFVFKNSGIYSFWMKDMFFDIDIIWLDADKKVVAIEKSAKPESYPESFNPGVEAIYVVEVVAGFSSQHGLSIGDTIEFDSTDFEPSEDSDLEIIST